MRRAATLATLAALLAAGSARAATAGADGVLYGLTIDRVSRPAAIAARLAALPRRPTTRVYFDVHEPAAHYRAVLEAIHPVSGVMGELLDSSDERSISTEAFASRVGSYLGTLGGLVDVWEVGNEVNGNWTGPYDVVAAKLTEAFDAVHAAGGRTALTLYANDFGPEHCGDGEAEPTPAQFTERWVAPAVAAGLDYVLLSYYPTQCGGRLPSSLEVALELEALHGLYPRALLGFGEVGLPHPASTRTRAQAEAIMSWAYSLAPGLPYYIGGYFWWYGSEDVLSPRARLAGALARAFEAEAAALYG